MKIGAILDYQVQDNCVTVIFENEKVDVQLINDKTVRFYSDFGSEKIKSTVVDTDKKEESQLSVCRFGKSIVIKTKAIVIYIFDEFKVDIYDSEREPICKDYRDKRLPKVVVSQESIELMKKEGHNVCAAKDSYPVEVVKEMGELEAIYGLGDSAGFLNKKGYAYELWNSDNPMPHVESFKRLYKSIPFIICKSPRKVYGIFQDNTFHSYWDFGKENRDYFYFAADGGNLNYYFFAGDSIKEIISEYTKLTGRVPLPQLWALGYHQSRWGYESKKDVLELSHKMREVKVPCDVIHFDIDYMDNYKVFTFNKDRFDNPKELMTDLDKNGFKVVTILDPGVKVEKKYKVYEEGVEKGYFAKNTDGTVYENVVWPGDSVYPDFGKEEVRSWWADMQKFYVDLGVRGIWNDMNEPASFRGEIPEDIVFYNEDKKTTHAQMHNVYGHFMSRAVHEGLKKYDKRRPFVITRACYAGSQKYTTAWTGDNHSIWSHLQMAIPQLCNLGMTGMGFVGTDIGGFGSDPTSELMIRWIQVGVFSPLCRNHSGKGQIYQEPWQFDEATLNIYRKYVELRYKLLPYIYDCFYDMSVTGLPVFKPLVLNYEQDSNVWEMNDEFMVGERILVAPVVTQGVKSRMVYLPEGEWIDYETGQNITGGKYFIRSTPLESCPIYVKAGTILPNYPVQQYIGEQTIDTLILQVFAGNGSYIHYQDDTESFAYEKGEYNLYEFSINEMHEFRAKIICQGYSKLYKNLKIIYQGKEYDIPLKNDICVTLS